MLKVFFKLASKKNTFENTPISPILNSTVNNTPF